MVEPGGGRRPHGNDCEGEERPGWRWTGEKSRSHLEGEKRSGRVGVYAQDISLKKEGKKKRERASEARLQRGWGEDPYRGGEKKGMKKNLVLEDTRSLKTPDEGRQGRTNVSDEKNWNLVGRGKERTMGKKKGLANEFCLDQERPILGKKGERTSRGPKLWGMEDLVQWETSLEQRRGK